ncbi:MAG TPA: arginine--tRNA ligase [Acidimicrobiales bacterium]|nr:arginine--tRNA ligase [Acidimicrobiales bacterium]
MAPLVSLVASRLQPGFDAIEPGADPVVRPSERADFQANGALALAKRLNLGNPRVVAEQIVAGVDTTGWAKRLEVAGPGFINVTIDEGWLAGLVSEQAGDPRLGVETSPTGRTVVIDYGSPNVAKEMHAGNLRSTIIGDALARLLGFTGDKVVRENHIGDWGTPFGMLIEHLVDLGEGPGAASLSVGELGEFYQDARRQFDSDPDFAERSRRRVVALQSGDPETLRLWKVLVDGSVDYMYAVFGRLGVLLTRDDVRGESAYNDLLATVVADLDAEGLLVQSDGARCVFPPGFTNREGQPLPLIVEKSDGGYGYAATDLAGLLDRFGRMGCDLALYVVGAPQSQHFEMCFAVARMAGWLEPPAEAVHVAFGLMLGADRKMFRARSGTSVKLAALVDEAVERAAAAVADKNPGLSTDAAAEVARMVGVGALKYADLSTDRTRDYVFDWDRMLAFDGNTAPYLQYAHARIRSIFRRAGEGVGERTPILLAQAPERVLAVALLGFSGAVAAATETFSPHKLCSYLFDLAGTFTSFYESCPVLRADDPHVRASRLALCDVTARVLGCGLGLLGIEAPERM